MRCLHFWNVVSCQGKFADENSLAHFYKKTPIEQNVLLEFKHFFSILGLRKTITHFKNLLRILLRNSGGTFNASNQNFKIFSSMHKFGIFYHWPKTWDLSFWWNNLFEILKGWLSGLSHCNKIRIPVQTPLSAELGLGIQPHYKTLANLWVEIRNIRFVGLYPQQ